MGRRDSMILYVSESKVNNLLEEMQFNQRITLSPFSTVKFSLSGLETVAHVNEPGDSVGYKLRKVVKYLKTSGRLKGSIQDKRTFLKLSYYRCFGAMHLHKITDTMTGFTIKSQTCDVQSNTLWNFDVDISNRFFNRLIITCSAKNLTFLDFSDANNVVLNSIGIYLLSTSKAVPVELIFMVTDTDDTQKTIYGSPLIITF